MNGGGNVIADPLFCAVDPIALRDVRIRSDSPAAPRNSAGCGLIGSAEMGCEAVAVEKTTWGRLKELFR
jgi:hypothetical protein